MVKNDQAPLGKLSTHVEARRQPAEHAKVRLLSIGDLKLEQAKKGVKAPKVPAGPTPAELEKKKHEEEIAKLTAERTAEKKAAQEQLDAAAKRTKELEQRLPTSDTEKFAGQQKFGAAIDRLLDGMKPEEQVKSSHAFAALLLVLRRRDERGESLNREVAIGKFREAELIVGGGWKADKDEIPVTLAANKSIIIDHLAYLDRSGSIDPVNLAAYLKQFLDDPTLDDSRGAHAKGIAGLFKAGKEKLEQSRNKGKVAQDDGQLPAPGEKVFPGLNAKR